MRDALHSSGHVEFQYSLGRDQDSRTLTQSREVGTHASDGDKLGTTIGAARSDGCLL